MYTIDRYPTRTVISGYELGDAKKMEKFLSVWDPIYFKYSFEGFEYDEEEEQITFPAGINHKMLYAILRDVSDISINDHRMKVMTESPESTGVTMKYPPRDHLQRKAIDFLVKDKFNENQSQKMLSLKTGEGKTYCSINASVYLRKKPLIVLSSTKLMEQWKNAILEFTNVEEDEIYILQGRPSIKRLLKKNKKDISKYKFYVAMNKTIINALEESDQFLEDLKSKTGISLKIFDEIHQDFASKFFIDIHMDNPSIYLSATPERSDRSEDMVMKNIYWDVPKFFSESIRPHLRKNPDKYHTVVMYRLNSNPTEMDKAEFAKASKLRGINIHHYSKYLMEDEEKWEDYLETIYSIIRDIIPGNKVIIMFNLKKQIDDFYEYLEKNMDKFSEDVVIRYYDGIDKEEKAKVNDAMIIISTPKSLGTGSDIPGLKSIINTVPMSSESLVTQVMGRLRYIEGEKLIMFDIVDSGFTQLTAQARRRINLYKKKTNEIIDFKKQ